MTSRIAIVAVAAVLLCLAAESYSREIGARHRDGKFFLFPFPNVNEKLVVATTVCTDDAGCTADQYCRNFGGSTGMRCVAKLGNGNKCTRPAMCTSGKCPSICIFNTSICSQKCEA